MKICTNCKVSKDDSCFYMKQGKLVHYWCKDCNLENVKERKRELKRQCVEYKGNSCVDCNGVFHPAIYDFHHLDPNEKDFQIGSLSSTKLTESIKSELDKCVLLCANCHRLRHFGFSR